MSLLGYGLDNLSLMALTVATGFVVDDAIVMIENVVRFIEDGVPPLEAAYRGARQIGFTIVSLTVSLIAVFIPLLFMTGVVGRLFSEFAVTLSVSVVVSAVVSLTLTPMMCGRLLRPIDQEHPGRLARIFEAASALHARRLPPHAALVAAARAERAARRARSRWSAPCCSTSVIPKGFLPQQDTGIVTAVIEARRARPSRKMAELQARVVEIVQRDPAVAGVASFVGAGTINATPNTGQLTIALKPRRPARRRRRGDRSARPPDRSASPASPCS